MKFLELIPGPLIVALIEGVLSLVDTNIRQYFVEQPWLPIALAILSLLATLFNVYIKPKLMPSQAAAMSLTAGGGSSRWARLARVAMN